MAPDTLCALSQCELQVPPEHRRFNFMQAFAARLGGETISFLTFTGPLLGEATKVALLRKRVPLTYGVPALVVDNLLYNLSVVFFVMSGACVMLFSYHLPPPVYWVLLSIALIAGLGIVATALAAKNRVMLLTWVIDQLAELRLSPKVILKRRHHISHLETKVYDFYKHHPGCILRDDWLQSPRSYFERDRGLSRPPHARLPKPTIAGLHH
jgi:hypothetical protein